MRRIALLLLLALLPLGCFHARELTAVQRAFADAHPEARLDREFSLSLGAGTLSVASWLAAGFLPSEERHYARYLHALDGLAVSIYKVEHLSPTSAPLPALGSLHRSGWRTLLKVREESETVWVLYRERRAEVHDLYVFTLNEDELVLVRLEGDLGEVLTHILADHDVFGPDVLGTSGEESK